MTLVNQALTRLFDAVMAPLAWLSPTMGLVVLSLVTAIAVLVAFKWTADQPALARAKQQMQAAIFEMRLFNDDLVLLFRAQGEVIRRSLTYLRLSLAPTLWLLAPMLALLLHMEFHFGFTGLTTGEATLVKVGVAAQAADASATLLAPEAIRVETPGVVLPSEHEIVWRIRPVLAGSYQLRVRMGDREISKTLVVSDAVTRRSPIRPGIGLASQLLNPSEPPLPADTGMTSIAIDYPAREVLVAGWNVGWAGVYLALTLAFALVLKGVFRVTM